MKAVVYTKGNGEYCKYCEKARESLEKIGADASYIKVGEDITREGFLNKFKTFFNVDVNTVPQIILDDKYIGGFTELEELNLINNEVNIKDFDIEL